MTHHYGATFLELLRVPFTDINLVWGIVPLYFALLLNELTSAKANYRTAVQTGFSFLWAAAQWLYFYSRSHVGTPPRALNPAAPPINLVVTMIVLALGVLALYTGLRRRFPKFGSFLGHTRFSNYFTVVP